MAAEAVLPADPGWSWWGGGSVRLQLDVGFGDFGGVEFSGKGPWRGFGGVPLERKPPCLLPWGRGAGEGGVIL